MFRRLHHHRPVRGLWISGALVCLCLFSAGGVVSADWVDDQQIGVFRFRSEFRLRDIQEIVNELTDLQTDIETQLGLECSDRPIHIYLFANRYNYQRYLSVRVPAGMQRRALYVPSNEVGRLYVYRHNDLATDLRHETTHALLRNALPYVPLWIDEGFAEYYEVPGAQRLKGNPHRRELLWASRLGWQPNLTALEAHRDLLDLDGKDYRDAWAVVHFCLHGPAPAREALTAYLKQINDGDLPDPLSSHLRQRIPNVEAQIKQHVKQ